MSADFRSRPAPVQVFSVYPASGMTAVDGANLGDAMSVADDLILGDTYRLSPGVEPAELAATHCADPEQLTIAPRSETGLPDADLHLDCVASFMSTDGTLVEIVVLVELNRDRCTISQVHLYPLATLHPRRDYSLVRIERNAATRFAESICVAFARGTHITMADGRQVPVEDLQAGDTVLTRDHGPQPIRWIGDRTTRATGSFAPIRIAKGTLNNENDLIVSQNHRLFVYQRQDRLKAGRKEVLVHAKHLLNGGSVARTEGGFIDFFHLLFDRHEIIYAEGIAAETLLIDTRTRMALPHEIGKRITESDAHTREFDVRLSGGKVTVEQFRRASSG